MKRKKIASQYLLYGKTLGEVQVALDGCNCFAITDRKQIMFANRHGLNFEISCVKSDLKDKLKITTGTCPIF